MVATANGADERTPGPPAGVWWLEESIDGVRGCASRFWGVSRPSPTAGCGQSNVDIRLLVGEAQ